MKVIRVIALTVLLLAPLSLAATELKCPETPSNVEAYHYSWHLRGGLGWLAGLIFPRSGFGDLRVVYPKNGEGTVHSELVITSPDSEGGFYRYESDLEPDASRTHVTVHGYKWGTRARNERTVFDYPKRLARIHKVTPTATDDRVKLLPETEMRDVLTAIHFLRRNAHSLTSPLKTSIYSDGKEYPVIFRPTEAETFQLQGQQVKAHGFEIVDAPGGKRWPGNVRIWISDDARRIPFRIEIAETLASLRLELDSVDSCGFMNATN